MKICIYGAGAIGGYLGAMLSAAGSDVSLIARGPHLQAMQENGLELKIDGSEIVTHPTCTDDPAEVGPQDFVIITLKAHSVPAISQPLQALLGPETAIVTAINGVPWWYFYKIGGKHEGHRVASVDPDGQLWSDLAPERVIGSVVYPATEVIAPGVIEHQYGERFVLGEPSGEKTERIQALSKELIAAGLKAPIRPRIRDEMWVKLWGNLSFNPVSALTGATLKTMAEDSGTRAIIRAMMIEGQQVGEALGVNFKIDVDARIDGARNVGEHKTSMLQDLELGRPMEIDALVTAVAEMGNMVGIDTPTIDTVLALVIQKARQAGCYGQ